MLTRYERAAIIGLRRMGNDVFVIGDVLNIDYELVRTTIEEYKNQPHATQSNRKDL